MKTKFRYFLVLPILLAFAMPKAESQTLIQFWDFNPINVSASDSFGTATSYSQSNSMDSTMGEYPLTANYVAHGLTAAHIVYFRPTIHYNISAPGERDSILDLGTGGAAYYDYSSSNYSYFTTSDSSGVNGQGFIRTRNPSDSCEMYLYIPTTGYKNISMQYAISTSSSGAAQYNILSYSTNGGTSWNNLTTAMDTFNISGVYRPDTLLVNNTTTAQSLWYPVQINFTSDPNVNSNANFILKWMIAGSNSPTSSHNDRYDNIAVWGTPTSGIENLPAQAAGYNVYPNPVQNAVNINSNIYKGTKVITLYNVVGQTISVTENQEKLTSINTADLTSGVYFVEIKEVSTGNKYTVKIVKE